VLFVALTVYDGDDVGCVAPVNLGGERYGGCAAPVREGLGIHAAPVREGQTHCPVSVGGRQGCCPACGGKRRYVTHARTARRDDEEIPLGNDGRQIEGIACHLVKIQLFKFNIPRQIARYSVNTVEVAAVTDTGLFPRRLPQLLMIVGADGGRLAVVADGDAVREVGKDEALAAANLNVVGARLIFTDLQYCVAISEDGEPTAISADNHQELWEAAGEEARISYGGNLYCIDGVKSYLAGEIEFEQLDFNQMAGDAFYLSPIVAEGYFLVITVGETGVGDITPLAHQGDITPRAHRGDITSQPLTNRGSTTTVPLAAQVYRSDTTNIITVVDSQGNEQHYQGSGSDYIHKTAVVGGKLYVETKQYSTTAGDHNQKITIVDLETGKVMGHYEGQNLQASNEGAYFQSGDRIVRIDPQNNTARQINTAPADTYMFAGPDGALHYQTVLDPGPPRVMIDMKTKRQENGQNYTGRDMSRIEWLFYKGKAYVFGGEIVGFERIEQEWVRAKIEKTGIISRETTFRPLDSWNEVKYGKPLKPTLVTDIGGIVPITAKEEQEARRKKTEESLKATPPPDPMEAFTSGTDDDEPAASGTDDDDPETSNPPAPDTTVTPTPTPAITQPLGGEHYVDLNGGTIKGKWRNQTSQWGDIILEFTNGKVTIFHTEDGYTLPCSYTIRKEASTQNHVYWTDYTHMIQFAPDDPDEFYIGFIVTNFYANDDVPIATTPADNVLYIGGMVFKPMD
jgi:hypothetical protein